MTRRAAAGLGAALALLAAGAAARAESIDDPKVSRRLGTRLAAPPLVPAVARGEGAAGEVMPVAATVDAPEAAAGPSLAAGPPVETLARPAATAPVEPVRRHTGRVQLAFRRFDFIRIGATEPGSTTGTAADETFNSLSLDLYPVSSYLRFGLSTQYGWQAGKFATSGDYFVAQSFSLGGQLPGRVVTPFADAFAGGGYMRRLQFDHTIPTVYWQLGIDAGVQVFAPSGGFVSFALGYLHPVNGFAKEVSFASVFVDTWSFKLGVGL